MPSYKAPIDDVMFLLRDVFEIERYNNLPGFSDATPDVIEAVLTEAGRLSEAVLLPLNQSGDRQGCTRHPDGSVTTPDGFKEAYKLYAEGGWGSVSGDTTYGGQGLPQVLGMIVNEFCTSANMAFTMYPGLTQSAFSAAACRPRHGEAQKAALRSEA